MVVNDHIDTTGRRPVVEGSDIKVSQIASEHELEGMSPDEIVASHPHLHLADVHAALAFYFDHLDAIRNEWDEDRGLVDALRLHYRRPARRR